MTRLLVQMHGHPGSGKTTLARALGAALPATVIDKDVIASALIRTGGAFADVGAWSYAVMYAQAGQFLADGHDVIMGSPCFWPIIEHTTRSIAASAGATWAMLETICPDDVLDHRLATRSRLESNPAQRDLGPMRPGMYNPDCQRLTLDTTHPLPALVGEAIAYLRQLALSPRDDRLQATEVWRQESTHISEVRP